MLKEQQEALERISDIFNEKYFNNSIRQFVLTIQSGLEKKAYGWCTTAKVWFDRRFDKVDDEGKLVTDDKHSYYEINIATETLDNIENACETLLHEMVHLWNVQNGIVDCRNSGYHETPFKEKCEEIGLRVKKVNRIGWSNTSLSQAQKDFIKTLNMEDIFCLRRTSEVKTKTVKESKKKYRYICASCGFKAISETEGLEIICNKCGDMYGML